MKSPLTSYDLVTPSDDAVLFCARLIHVAVEGLNEEFGIPTIPWEQSREALIAGIERVVENPNETPEENHEAWRKFRTGEGWVYGPVKDIALKTHPSLVSYGELPATERAKNAIFLNMVRSFFGLES